MSQLSKYDLSGYVTFGAPETQIYNGKTYEIQRYQGEHENEYTVKEVGNDVETGKWQLFKDGMLVRSWEKIKGQLVGNITLYKDGVVDRVLIHKKIAEGRLSLNYAETLKCDAPVKAGDIISLRGLGKGEITGTGGSSRKGRLFVYGRIYK